MFFLFILWHFLDSDFVCLYFLAAGQKICISWLVLVGRFFVFVFLCWSDLYLFFSFRGISCMSNFLYFYFSGQKVCISWQVLVGRLPAWASYPPTPTAVNLFPSPLFQVPFGLSKRTTLQNVTKIQRLHLSHIDVTFFIKTKQKFP